MIAYHFTGVPHGDGVLRYFDGMPGLAAGASALGALNTTDQLCRVVKPVNTCVRRRGSNEEYPAKLFGFNDDVLRGVSVAEFFCPPRFRRILANYLVIVSMRKGEAGRLSSHQTLSDQLT